MRDRRAAATAQVLRVLARLAPPATPDGGEWSIPLDWFHWLRAGAAPFVVERTVRTGLTDLSFSWSSAHHVAEPDLVAPTLALGADVAVRLAHVDALRPDASSLRVGWLFLAGRPTDGARREVFQPLVSRAVAVRRTTTSIPSTNELVPIGDTHASPLIGDVETRAGLESTVETGGGALSGAGTSVDPGLLRRLDRLTGYAQRAAAAAGFPGAPVVPADGPPELLRQRDGVAVVVGLGVYAVHPTPAIGSGASLRVWAGADLREPTAFHALTTHPPGEPEVDTDPLHELVPLTPRQREAVRLARSAPVSVVTGAPGNGKSTTICAIAADAVARGTSVLVAAASDAAVDALVELFDETPGLDPIVFGSTERLRAVLDRVTHAADRPTSETERDAARAALAEAVGTRDRRREGIAAALGAEQARPDADELEWVAEVAPPLLDPSTDLDEIAALVAAARAERPRRWSRRIDGPAARRLDEILAVDHAVDAAEEALPVARLARAAARSDREGGLTTEADLDQLAADERLVSARAADVVDREARSAERNDRRTRRALERLAEVLTLGRAARRAELAALSAEGVATALPLWVGSLADVDDLLPVVPAMFDLVVLDEASAVDQVLAASALLRGRRAVVVGDPRQLRPVVHVTDAEVDAALAAEGITDPALAARLDVRHTTVLDLAIGAAPVVTLDEHFRSAPHLVDLVARRCYGGSFAAATRNPSTAALDCIDVIRVAGERTSSRVVEAEVTAVVAELRRLHRQGFRDVGVLTPSRAQASAIEAAVLDQLRSSTTDALSLRVGTVADFQGMERDVIVASLGIGDHADPAAWRTLDDPHLFAVMATRARDHMIVVTSGTPPPGSLVADYLATADTPPGPPPPAAPPTGWTATVHHHLTSAGIPATPDYPTGRHTIDLCIGDPTRWFGLECRPHPDGPHAHIDRHLALRHTGWTLHDAYPSRWEGHEHDLVDHVRRLLGSG